MRLPAGYTPQPLLDYDHALGPLARIYFNHLRQQPPKFGIPRIMPTAQWGKEKGRERRIVARKQSVECCAETINVGSGCCLRSPVLLWRGIAWRTKGNGIVRLAMFEMAGDPKVDQIEVSIRFQHHIRRFEVAEDDGWLSPMEVVQRVAELKTDFEDINQGETSARRSPGMFLKGYTLNEIHHEIPAPSFRKKVVDSWKMRMAQFGEHEDLALESIEDDLRYLRTGVENHLLDSNRSIRESRVLRLIDCSKATLPYLIEESIALLQ
jgi:hypothetical protein